MSKFAIIIDLQDLEKFDILWDVNENFSIPNFSIEICVYVCVYAFCITLYHSLKITHTQISMLKFCLEKFSLTSHDVSKQFPRND